MIVSIIIVVFILLAIIFIVTEMRKRAEYKRVVASTERAYQEQIIRKRSAS